jgi:hypothetical protein
MRGGGALAAMLLGAALLFWGLGGTWDEDGYSAEAEPRVAAVHVGASADAALSMTSLPGSTVFLDDARTTSLRSPFVRAAVPPGKHALRVHSGDGAEDARVVPFELAPGDEVALVPLGPTLSFHTLADEAAVHPGSRRSWVAVAADGHVGPGGIAVVAGALLALLGAAGALSAWSLPSAKPRVLAAMAAGVLATGVGPFLLVRVALLFPFAEKTGIVVVSVGAVVLLRAVWSALAFDGLRRWLAFAAGAPAGLTFIALGLDGVAPAMGVMIATGSVAALLQLAVAWRGDDDTDAADPATPASRRETLLVRVPQRLGVLLVSMERWVVGATAAAIGGLARMAAWIVAMTDEHVVGTPGDAAASGVARAIRRVEPWVGVPLSALVWGALALGAVVVLLHAAWPGG